MPNYSIANNDTGLTTRNGINGNFSDLDKMLGADMMVAGSYYAAMRYPQLNAGTAPQSANLILMPIPVLRKGTLASLSTYVTTTETGKNFGLAVYAHNRSNGRPTGTPIATTGTSLATPATSLVNVDGPLTTPPQLDVGFYWFGFQCNTTTAVWQAPASTSGAFAAVVGDTNIDNVVGPSAQTVIQGLQIANTFGTWPDLTTPPSYGYQKSNRFPALYWKWSSFP